MTRIPPRLRTWLTIAALTVTAALLAAGPALATEEPVEKIQFPQTARDRVGLIILGVTALGAALMVMNAVKQLRGERPKASGKWRWR